MLRISRSIHDQIVTHARRDHPDEACGVVLGPEGSGRPESVVELTNAARSPTWYEFDPEEYKTQVYDRLWERDEEIMVVYHSHTMTEAYPSPTDVERATVAGEPQAHYVLVSTREPEVAEFRAYRILDGEVAEDAVEIVG